MKQLQTNLVRHEREREKQAQNAAEAKNAKLARHIWDVYEVFDGMRQSLRICGELEAEAAVRNRSTRNTAGWSNEADPVTHTVSFSRSIAAAFSPACFSALASMT